MHVHMAHSTAVWHGKMATDEDERDLRSGHVRKGLLLVLSSVLRRRQKFLGIVGKFLAHHTASYLSFSIT
jgi:hypothetical protein